MSVVRVDRTAAAAASAVVENAFVKTVRLLKRRARDARAGVARERVARKG